MRIKNLAMMACAFLIGQSAFARENFTLELNDRETTGNAVIQLKLLLQQQHNINPANFRFIGARLVAKSRQGQGTAQLVVGNWASYEQRVQGNPADYNRPGPGTFDRIDFGNDSGDDRGVWQIHLRGNIKTRKVVVVLDRGGGGGGGGGVRYQNIRCESTNNRPNECAVRGRVVSVRLLQQHSILACSADQTFGALQRSIWVRNGCRGTFEVGYRN